MNQLTVFLFITIYIIAFLIFISDILTTYILFKLVKNYKSLNTEFDNFKKLKLEDKSFDLSISMELKKCIDDLIEDEIMNVLKTYIVTNKKYDILKLDTDAKQIASNVYKAFKKEYLTKDILIFESEFYQSYMIKRTITRFILITTDYNLKSI